MICTFFGHSDCRDLVKEIKSVAENLIVNYSVDKFYIGNNGNFDKCAKKAIKDLSSLYPNIKFYVVLAYIPLKKKEELYEDDCETIIPDGIEKVPKKFGIIHRNRWMIEKSDYVIAYVTHSFGGASKFYELAKKKSKVCINLAD